MSKKRRALTISTPFELQTMKRVKLDVEDSQNANKEEYEPLWAQI